MGANAQTTVPTFTAAQVLTADQMNQSARTGVPVFAGTVERDAAFGGSGEKTLAEGQLCYLESTNVVQYYDGAVWATVGPQTLTSGLNYITGATFTTATSFSLPNNTFTATYRNYRLLIQITAVTSDADFTMRMRASGSDDTTSNYDYAFASATSGNAVAGVGALTQAQWVIGESDATNVFYNASFDILAPQVATRTHFSGVHSYVDKANTAIFARSGGGTFRASTQFDSLSFISSVASSITGVYRVYGYSDS